MLRQFAAENRREKWCFIHRERPEECNSRDEFVARMLRGMPFGAGIIVLRNGTETRQMADGSPCPHYLRGASKRTRYWVRKTDDQQVVTWRDVICGINGNFVRYTQPSDSLPGGYEADPYVEEAEDPKIMLRQLVSKRERWWFTKDELSRPEDCWSQDPFMGRNKRNTVKILRSDASSHPIFKLDGVNTDDVYVVQQRDVFCDVNGRFLRFADQSARVMIEQLTSELFNCQRL